MPTRHNKRKNKTHRRDERRKVAAENLGKQLARYRKVLAIAATPEAVKQWQEAIKKAETCLENTLENLSKF
jgi:ribosomal protein S4